MMTFLILVSTFGSLLHFSYVIYKIFFNFMSKLKYLMQQFQLKNCNFTLVRWFFKIQMKPFLVSDQFQWNWSETKIKCTVSVKLGTKKRAFLAKNWLKEQFHVKLDETGWFGFSFFGSKMKLAVVSWFYGAKIMKPSGSVGKKNETNGTRRSRVPLVSLFFPTEPVGFIILCPIKSWNHQPVSFLSQKNLKPIPASFIQFHVITDEKIKKNKGGFYWNLTVLHKTGQ